MRGISKLISFEKPGRKLFNVKLKIIRKRKFSNKIYSRLIHRRFFKQTFFVCLISWQKRQTSRKILLSQINPKKVKYGNKYWLA